MEQNFAALALDRRCDGRQPTKLSVAERPHMAAAKQLRLGWVRTARRKTASLAEQAHPKSCKSRNGGGTRQVPTRLAPVGAP
jgi:hypothetical protein